MHVGLRFLASEEEIQVPKREIGEAIRFDCELEHIKPWRASFSAFHESGQSPCLNQAGSGSAKQVWEIKGVSRREEGCSFCSDW